MPAYNHFFFISGTNYTELCPNMIETACSLLPKPAYMPEVNAPASLQHRDFDFDCRQRPSQGPNLWSNCCRMQYSMQGAPKYAIFNVMSHNRNNESLLQAGNTKFPDLFPRDY